MNKAEQETCADPSNPVVAPANAGKEASDEDLQQCIDPSKSVVVTACAGSGKTWLLTSRIIRIILENAADLEIDTGDGPAEDAGGKGSFRLSSILAITFTNNAAAEIEDRVRDRLREMAHEKDPSKFRAKLDEIGMTDSKYDSAYVAAAYRKFLLARPQLSIFTFHSWFSQLINYLPWDWRPSLNSAVAENTEYLKLQAWQRLLTHRIKPGSAEAGDMEFLLGCHKLKDIRELLANVLEDRGDWLLYYGCGPEDPGAYEKFEETLEQDFALPEQRRTMKDLHKSSEFKKSAEKVLELCGNSKNKDPQKAAAKLREILSGWDETSSSSFFRAMRDALLTKEGKPRKNLIKPCADTDDREHMVEEIQLTEKYENILSARRHNKACARIALLYCQEYKRIKEEEGVIDFADMEFYPLRALISGGDDTSVGSMLKRMGDAYRHILVDEFQDSSPIQWRVLREWLEYCEQKDADRPSVFVVGDPKQSIYSFRKGDPRLLDAAREYLCDENGNYRATPWQTNKTRRCAKPLVEALNAFFPDHADHAQLHYREHATVVDIAQSALYLLEGPADEEKEPEGPQGEKGLRDPLDPDAVAEPDKGEERARAEGMAIAAKIKNEIIGKKIIYDSKGQARECTAGDIMLLYPSGTNIHFLLNALIEADIPCVLPGASRMASLECQDMLALLHAIFDPTYSLMVAQVLRSPIFGIDEEELWNVFTAGRQEGQKYSSWFHGLNEAAKKEGASKELKEAARLLGKWRKAYREDKLPVHELLSMCYQEADITTSYARAVPKEIRKRTVLNLEWLLNHSLDANRGSLVLPSEYVDYLRGLEKSQDKSAADAEIPDAVKVHSIHGAKGLQSPVVFLANCNYQPGSEGNQLIVSWGKDEIGKEPEHISFYRSAASTETQDCFVELDKKIRKHENSNQMYVAMTRASHYLLLSKRSKKGTYKWWNQVQESLFAGKEGELCLGKEIEEADDSAVHRAEGDSKETEPPKLPKALTPAETKALKEKLREEKRMRKIPPSSEAAIRGTQLHNLLALELQGVKDESVQRRLLGIGRKQQEILSKDMENIIGNKQGFGEIWDQRSEVECELPAVDSEGGQKRIDCLLTTKEGVVWILDFKTGEEKRKDHKHAKQLREYRAIVKENHPQNTEIKMAIIYRDGSRWEIQPTG